jgi:hypothetical protein
MAYDASNRLKLLMELEALKTPYLEQQTGIAKRRWQTVKDSAAEMRVAEIQALEKLFPEYAYWLATGKEIPEAGQVSPLTKRAHKNYKVAD